MMHSNITSFFKQTLHRTLTLACVAALLMLSACSSNSGDGDTAGSTGGTSSGSTSGSSDGTTDDGGASAGSTTNGTAPQELGPLPSPPLSAAPSADDEPIALDSSFHTITSFALVQDPGERIPQPVEVTLTDEDFEAGPLPEVISTPDDVDPATNAAPTFENLNDVVAVAGENLEILYKPIDADGDGPGMFPEKLPPGASFDDNFDGTKTYRWQPLQNDVGINEFTVTAVDFRNSMYRTTRTIRIKVTLPEDESSIPNVPPLLEEDVVHTVQQNDAVVMELKGIDYNGTIPSLELISDLPGASFTQHPRYEEVFVLRFVPTSVGMQDIEILVRDSVDPTLTSIGTATVEVLAATQFNPPGERLKDLAANRGIQFGYSSLPFFYTRPDGGIYAQTAANEFDLVTPENSMKMDTVNPFPGRYQFADVDNLISFAQQHNMAVHGHPIIWHRQLPHWIQEVEPATLEGHMREYIDRLITRYNDSINLWDVVNEPIGDKGGFRKSIWFNAMGESYLDIAFRQARLSAPNATLLLNDFDIAFNGPKADSLFEVLDGLLEREVPIDGVGFQLHVFTSFDQFSDVRENFQKVADRGLDIYITEFDVAIAEGDNTAIQAQAYKQIVEICLEQPRCKAIQTWGFTDQYSFREIFEPLFFDKRYQSKPAYEAMQDALLSQ